jgi:tetratricopeptide (TPR) repeat protein
MPAVPDLLAEAVRLHRAGFLASAETAYRAVIAAAPGHAAALVNLANLLRGQGDHAGAIAACRHALSQAPRLPEAHITLGACLLSARRPEAAVAAYRGAVALRPGSAVAEAGLGVALLHLNQPTPALLAAEAACAADPRLAEAWFVRGSALAALGRPGDAVTALETAVARDPSHARAHLNLGNAWLDLDRFAPAEQHLRRAIALAPALPEAHASLGFLLTGSGRLADAVAACDEAIRLRPDFAQAYWNRSFAEFLAGDYAPAWDDYEWRKQHDRFGRHFRRLPGPEWRGEALAGRRLLVLAEQGLGDTIQFARFLPLLSERGARVVLACAPSLLALLAQLPAEMVAKTAQLPPYDLWVDQMSLPRLLATRVGSIPAAGGYLAADPARVAVARPPAARAAGRARLGRQSRPFQRRPALHAGGVASPAAGVPHRALRQPAGRTGQRRGEAARPGRQRRRARRLRRDRRPGERARSGDRGGHLDRPSGRRAGLSGVGPAALRARLALDGRARRQPMVCVHAPVPPAPAGRLGRPDRARCRRSGTAIRHNRIAGRRAQIGARCSTSTGGRRTRRS